jgi:ComF family protein
MRIIHTIRKFSAEISNGAGFILNLLFPEKCAGCGKNNETLCRECGLKLPRLEQNEHGETYLIAAVDYKNKIIKKIIWRLKYKKSKQAGKALAQLLYERSLEEISELANFSNLGSCLFIPIPLSRERLKERGFNQSELVAGYFLEKLNANLIVSTDILYKIKETPTQVSIKNRPLRLANLKGAFAVKNPDKAAGKTVFLIDDVSTTGATLYEASEALKKAGAKKIISLVIAKG